MVFLKKRFNFFLDFGYSSYEVISIISRYPKLFDYNGSLIQKKFEEFKELGFENRDIIKITFVCPELFFSSLNIINEKFLYLLDFGYSEIDIINIIKKIPIILKNYYLDKLNVNINCLLELGFSNKDIIMITCNNPYVLLYTDDILIDKFNNLLFFEFSLNDIRNMFIQLPILFGYDMQTINNRINYYISINLKNIIVKDTKIWIHPLELITNRYNFISIKENIDQSNYNLLFLNDRDFYKKFKISKEELLKGEF